MLVGEFCIENLIACIYASASILEACHVNFMALFHVHDSFSLSPIVDLFRESGPQLHPECYF